MSEEKIKEKKTEEETLEFELSVIPFDFGKKGRRTKCTPELIQEVAVRIARDGCTYLDAAKLSGISPASFQIWMRRGRKEQARLIALGLDSSDEDAVDAYELPFLEFFETIDKAIPLRKTLLVERIRNAGKDPRNWTANAWLLERLHPDEFGRKTRLEIKQIDWREEVIELIQHGVPFDLVVEKIGEDEARQLFERAGVEIPGIGASGEAER